MSKRNRERRKWKCHGCGAGLHPELAGPAARAFAAAAKGGPVDPKGVVHVCGLCKTFHYDRGDALRTLTPAELFALHFEAPKVTAAVLAQVCPPSAVPAGTLHIGAE